MTIPSFVRWMCLLPLLCLSIAHAVEIGPAKFFDMKALLDESTLETVISKDRVQPSKVRPGKNVRVIELKFTSQNWHGMVWKHPARIYVPDGYKGGGNAGIYGTHQLSFNAPYSAQQTIPGTQLNNEEQFGEATALDLDMPIMFFSNPSENLQGMNEDDLMGFAMKKALTTGDLTWDGYSAIATGYLRAITLMHSLPGVQTERAVLMGCSKRGVAVSLATGVDPQRIAGVMSACYQGGNQLYAIASKFAQFGPTVRGPAKVSNGPGYQPAEGLLRAFNSPMGLAYLTAFDPYLWRGQIKSNYLVTLGTNDEFFALGAANSMMKEMPGDKAFLAVDNLPHTAVSQKHLAAWRMWLAHTFLKRPVPKIESKGVTEADQLAVSAKVTAPTQPVSVKLYYAYNHVTSDWRAAKWQSMPMDSTDGGYAARLPIKGNQKLAYYVEVEDAGVGGAGYVSSLIEIVE
ncbi:MAG: PhoPQ-activated protein PqaA family protein [Pseudomonadota bacterium]